MSLEPKPNELDELDTPGPFEVMPPRRLPRKALSSVLGMSADALAAIPRRRQRPTLAAQAQSARGAEAGPPSAQATVARTGRTQPGDNQIRPPRVTAGATNSREIDKLFRECTDAAQQFENSKVRRDHLLIVCLQKAARLCEYGESKGSKDYKQLLARHGIRKTGRNQNPFLLIVKLIFASAGDGKDKNSRTSLSRYAGVLRFARGKGIKPDALPQFIETEGGLDACAERDREVHPSPERQASATKHAAHLRALRAQAQTAELAALGDGLPGRFTALLVEKDPHGALRILGLRAEPDKNVRKYQPL